MRPKKTTINEKKESKEKQTILTIEDQAKNLMKERNVKEVYLSDGLWFFKEKNASGKEVVKFEL